MRFFFQSVLVLFFSTLIVFSLYRLTYIVYPVNLKKNQIDETAILVSRLTEFFNIEPELARSIVKYSLIEEVDPFLIASLFYTESKFNDKAVSPKNYRGISQIPARWHTPYVDVNILTGIKIFKEKLQIAENDIETAIRLYKGYSSKNQKYKKEVQKVMKIYRQLVDAHQFNNYWHETAS